MKITYCQNCMYQAGPYAGYVCDYVAITGRTRRAQPVGKGCTYKVVQGTKRDTDAARKNRQKPPAPVTRKRRSLDTVQAMALYRQGCSDCEIARRVNICKTAIVGWRKRCGLPPNFTPGGKKIQIDG